MRVLEPRMILSTIVLPCDLCGTEVRTVSIYLKAKSNKKMLPGFYSDLSICLCEHCIDKMKKVLS